MAASLVEPHHQREASAHQTAGQCHTGQPLTACRLPQNVIIAEIRAMTSAVWYDIAEKIVIENIGKIGQTTDIVAVKTEAARAGSGVRRT